MRNNFNNIRTGQLTEKFSAISDLLSLYNVYLNLKQSNNDDIMSELRKQDTEYFGKVLDMLIKIDGRLDNIEEKLNKSENNSCIY